MSKNATHIISAVYYPNHNEIELTWEDIEDKKHAELTVKVSPEKGDEISSCISPCVYHPAVNNELIKNIIRECAQYLDPECPDIDAYVDGHCSLLSLIKLKCKKKENIKWNLK